MRSVHGAAAVLALALLCGSPARASDPPIATFDVDGPIRSGEGHATLSWSADDPSGGTVEFALQESREPGFDDASVRYRGPDRASFVSGLPGGTTWFRVRAAADGRTGPWSEPIRVDVEYPSRTKVVALLAVGATVFLCTVGFVIAGHRRHRVRIR